MKRLFPRVLGVPHGLPEARGTHRHRVRVLYGDTDRAGVVHHAAYLHYVEAGRLEFFRHRGLVYRELEERTGLGLPVIDLQVRYHAPALFDDLLDLETFALKVTRARAEFATVIHRGDEVLVEVQTTIACVDLRTGHARSLPDEVQRVCVP